MSFIFETMDVPFWFLLFALGSAAPLWIQWYKIFHKKFIKTGLLKRKLNKVKETAEEQVDILKKATDNWNSSVEEEGKKTDLAKSKSERSVNEAKQPYVKIVLKTLALKGDAGMLIQSIADSLNISSNEIKSSLSYLEQNDFVEVVAGAHGTKYYLAQRGKNYCIKRGYIKE